MTTPTAPARTQAAGEALPRKRRTITVEELRQRAEQTQKLESQFMSGALNPNDDQAIAYHLNCLRTAITYAANTLEHAATALADATARATTAEATLQQVRQHRESILRHCAEIERAFAPSTRWRAIPLLERAERVGIVEGIE